MLKKLLSVLLAVIIAVTCSGFVLAYERDTDHDPVILVPGYSSSPLFRDGKQIWGLDMEAVLGVALDNIAQIGISLGALAFGNPDRIVDLVGPKMMDFLRPLAIKGDYSDVDEVKPGQTTPEESCMTYLVEKYGAKHIVEPEIMAGFADVVGEENCFVFYCDFRRGAIECAKSLNSYVKKIKEYTGAEKVDIYAVSHGGQVTGTYLSLFDASDDVDNVVLNVPALGGAAIAYDAMNADVKLDEKLLVYFVECGLVSETNYEWLLSANQLGILDEVANTLASKYILKELAYLGSLWDFIPVQYYDELKARFLNENDNSVLIASSDEMHYDIMPNFGKAFNEAREKGIDLSIMSSTGHNAVTGLQWNSDAIIPTECSSGAKCAPYGKRFSDGYTCSGDGCKNPAHYHLSPSMEIDASYAWLPDNTWFVEGQFHGMSYWDEYSRILARKLLLTDELTDVYSSPDYPQFGLTHNPTDALYIEFDKSPQGFISGEDRYITITNLSEKYPITINKITCKGMNIRFKTAKAGIIAPRKSATLEIIGNVPDVSLKRTLITVDFFQIGAVSCVSQRTFDYTILGGEPVKFDSKADYLSVDYVEENMDLLNNWLICISGPIDYANVISIILTTIRTIFEMIFRESLI